MSGAQRRHKSAGQRGNGQTQGTCTWRRGHGLASMCALVASAAHLLGVDIPHHTAGSSAPRIKVALIGATLRIVEQWLEVLQVTPTYCSAWHLVPALPCRPACCRFPQQPACRVAPPKSVPLCPLLFAHLTPIHPTPSCPHLKDGPLLGPAEAVRRGGQAHAEATRRAVKRVVVHAHVAGAGSNHLCDGRRDVECLAWCPLNTITSAPYSSCSAIPLWRRFKGSPLFCAASMAVPSCQPVPPACGPPMKSSSHSPSPPTSNSAPVWCSASMRAQLRPSCVCVWVVGARSGALLGLSSSGVCQVGHDAAATGRKQDIVSAADVLRCPNPSQLRRKHTPGTWPGRGAGAGPPSHRPPHPCWTANGSGDALV